MTTSNRTGVFSPLVPYWSIFLSRLLPPLVELLFPLVLPVEEDEDDVTLLAISW